MAPVKDRKFLPEIWALYSIGVLWVALRFAVRLRTVGLRGLQIDDAFAFFAVLCWTIIIVGIHVTYSTATNIDYSASEVWDLTEHQAEMASFGSKLYIITLYAYIAMIFSLKAVVVILYRRLAFGIWQKKLLNFTIAVCIVGFISTTLMLSLMCLPFERRFQVRPLPGNVCTASSAFFIVLSCFNALTDALLLTVPLPMLWTLRIPLPRRVGVFLLISSGIFVMSACIIRVSLTVVPNITVRIIARWGARELAIALVAVNTASLRPMFRKNFWLSEHALAERRNSPPRNFYVWGFLHRINRMINKRFPLNSTTAGDSTIQNFTAEEGTRAQTDLYDPGVHRISQSVRVLESMSERRGGWGRSVIETFVYGQSRTGKERDLEKNTNQYATRSVEGTRSVSPELRLDATKNSVDVPPKSEKTLTSPNTISLG